MAYVLRGSLGANHVGLGNIKGAGHTGRWLGGYAVRTHPDIEPSGFDNESHLAIIEGESGNGQTKSHLLLFLRPQHDLLESLQLLLVSHNRSNSISLFNVRLKEGTRKESGRGKKEMGNVQGIVGLHLRRFGFLYS